jgi:Kef-type K+ transport system membrane component KefB
MLAGTLRDHPEFALFLALAIGYALGRLRLGSFQLGSVLGTLIAGVGLGLLGGVGAREHDDCPTPWGFPDGAANDRPHAIRG